MSFLPFLRVCHFFGCDFPLNYKPFWRCIFILGHLKYLSCVVGLCNLSIIHQWIPTQAVFNRFSEIMMIWYFKFAAGKIRRPLQMHSFIFKRGCVCLSVGPSVSWSVCLSVSWSVCLSVRRSVRLSVHWSVCPSVGPSCSSWKLKSFCNVSLVYKQIVKMIVMSYEPEPMNISYHWHKHAGLRKCTQKHTNQLCCFCSTKLWCDNWKGCGMNELRSL